MRTDEMGGTKLADSYRYTFFCGGRNANPYLGTGFFAHNRILSAVKLVEFLTNWMPHTIVTGHWCDIEPQPCPRYTALRAG